MKFAIGASVAALALAGAADAADLHVPAQYPTIQAAVDAAVPVDVVLVAPGEYLETVNLLGKPITLRSVELHASIIRAPQGSRCVVEESNEPPSTVVEGFTLGRAGAVGGGVLVSNASPRFMRCRLVSCINAEGGALRVIGGSAVFDQCDFSDCVGTGPSGTYGSAGGAHLSGGATTFNACKFVDCDGGGAADAILHDVGGSVVVRDSEIVGGGASNYFGQVYNAVGSLLVEDTVFDGGNKAAIFAWSPWTVRRCVFRNMNGYSVLDRRGGQYTIDECRFEDCAVTGPLLASTYSGSFALQNTTVCRCTWSGNMIQGAWSDLGGNEFTCPCPGDITGGGEVSGIDLAAVLGAWGTDGQGKFDCDVNGDGIVNGADLAAVLSGWGPCPS
jgi:hypothetical protein